MVPQAIFHTSWTELKLKHPSAQDQRLATPLPRKLPLDEGGHATLCLPSAPSHFGSARSLYVAPLEGVVEPNLFGCFVPPTEPPSSQPTVL
jgi:hypothetical protein